MGKQFFNSLDAVEAARARAAKRKQPKPANTDAIRAYKAQQEAELAQGMARAALEFAKFQEDQRKIEAGIRRERLEREAARQREINEKHGQLVASAQAEAAAVLAQVQANRAREAELEVLRAMPASDHRHAVKEVVSLPKVPRIDAMKAELAQAKTLGIYTAVHARIKKQAAEAFYSAPQWQLPAWQAFAESL